MEKQNPKKVIVILGSGRSGTSLLMNTLGKLGMDFSPNMIPGKYENPEGFFEDTQIVDIHRGLMERLNVKPTLPMPDNWMKTPEVAKAKRQLVQIVKERVNDAKNIWGFKDPRINAFLPLWIQVFNQAGVVPVFILSVRNPLSVAVSLKRLLDRDEVLSELQWLLRTCNALQYIAADCFILHFEQWFSKAKTIATDLLKYTGLDEFFSGEVETAIDGLAKSHLNRSSLHDGQIQNCFVRDLYEVLENCYGHSFDREKVMASVNRANQAMNAFKGWAMEINGTASKFKKFTRENAELLKEKKQLQLMLSCYSNNTELYSDGLSPEPIVFNKRIRGLDESVSFQLGQTIILAVKKPGMNTILLPFRLLRLMFTVIINRRNA